MIQVKVPNGIIENEGYFIGASTSHTPTYLTKLNPSCPSRSVHDKILKRQATVQEMHEHTSSERMQILLIYLKYIKYKNLKAKVLISDRVAWHP